MRAFRCVKFGRIASVERTGLGRGRPAVGSGGPPSAARPITELNPLRRFEVITDAFPQWNGVLKGIDKAAGALREDYLFPHGLGWLAVTQAAAKYIEVLGDGWEGPFRTAVASFDWKRGAPLWQGHEVINGRVNNTGPAVRDLARKITEASPVDAN